MYSSVEKIDGHSDIFDNPDIFSILIHWTILTYFQDNLKSQNKQNNKYTYLFVWTDSGDNKLI